MIIKTLIISNDLLKAIHVFEVYRITNFFFFISSSILCQKGALSNILVSGGYMHFFLYIIIIIIILLIIRHIYTVLHKDVIDSDVFTLRHW
jgi:hypothetical protein